MRIRPTLLACSVVCAALQLGCAPSATAPQADSSDEQTPAAASVDDAAAAADVQLRSLALADFDQTLAEHQGKVVLLDLWATW